MKHIYSGLIVPLAVLIPLFFAYLKRRHLSPEAIVILVYLILDGLVNVLAKVMAINKINNLPLLHVFTCLEFILFAQFYKIVLGERKQDLKYAIIQGSFTLICILNAVFLQSIYTFNSYTLSLSGFIIMFFAINYYAKIFNLTLDVKVTSLPAFWFNAGIFLYFACSFFLYVFSNFILQLSKHAFNLTWDIKNTFLVIMYLLFSIAFYKCKK